MRIYIGHDRREQRAFDVAASTARAFGHEVIPLYESRLRASGLYTRPVDRRGDQIWAMISNVEQSTDFAVTRFAVPMLAHAGWCLFVDCDVVFMQDPNCLKKYADESKAICVVKHQNFTGLDSVKMDGQKQKVYPRKFWSSVMLWNCDHPANRRLNLAALNQWHRDDLHAFRWLAADEIGELPFEANWLVGVTPKPESPIIAHYTLGTPDMIGSHSEHSEIWNKVSEQLPC